MSYLETLPLQSLEWMWQGTHLSPGCLYLPLQALHQWGHVVQGGLSRILDSDRGGWGGGVHSHHWSDRKLSGGGTPAKHPLGLKKLIVPCKCGVEEA